MSQNSVILPTTGTVSGLAMTQATNNALDTLNTLSSGSSAPSSPEAGQLWHDTANNIINLRDQANTAWIPLLNISETTKLAEPAYTMQNTGLANRIINGDMRIDQVNEGGSYSLPTNNTYTYSCDQWLSACTSASANTLTVQQTNTAPPNNLSYSLKTSVGVGASSVGTNDFLLLWQPIEANNINDFAYGSAQAAAISLSFWFKSSVAGTYCVSLQNEAGSRSLLRPFTITSANTWQLITLNNIPGDTAGTWVMNGAVSAMRVYFTAACGTGYQSATVNSWLAGAYYATTSQNNSVLTTSGASFQVSGVMLNRGSFALPFEKPSYAQSLGQCERYFEKTFPQGTAVAQSAGVTGSFGLITAAAGAAGIQAAFRTPKRTTPTLITYNPSAANANWRDGTNGADRTVGSPVNLSDKGFLAFITGGAVASAGNYLHYTANARM